jgi:hypothetical protein
VRRYSVTDGSDFDAEHAQSGQQSLFKSFRIESNSADPPLRPVLSIQRPGALAQVLIDEFVSGLMLGGGGVHSNSCAVVAFPEAVVQSPHRVGPLCRASRHVSTTFRGFRKLCG